MLLVLLPIAKFIHKTPRICSLLQDCLIHASLDHTFKPMKMAAINGIMMFDSLGFQRFCFPFIASYTVDTLEAQMLACVGAKSSPVTTAFYKSLGDDFQHEPRTASITMAQINNILLNADLSDLPAFLKEAQKFHLSSVHAPFWRDWRFAHPCILLTPEPLTIGINNSGIMIANGAFKLWAQLKLTFDSRFFRPWWVGTSLRMVYCVLNKLLVMISMKSSVILWLS